MSLEDHKRLVESALFSAGRALSLEEINTATQLTNKKTTAAINALTQEYNLDNNRSIEIIKAGNKYAMQLKANYVENVRTLAKAEISPYLLKTLALIAFHQPLKQSELRHMIGPKIYEHVDLLADKGLIKTKKHGATELLTTTKLFPEYFGIDTTDPDELKAFLAKKTGIKKEK